MTQTTYTMTGPDGKDYSIDGPAGASQEQVAAQMQQQFGGQAAQQDSKPSGLDGAVGAGSAVSGFAGGANTALLGAPHLLAAAANSVWHGTPFADEYSKAAQYYKQGEQQHPMAALAGGILASAPLAVATDGLIGPAALTKGATLANAGRLAAQGAKTGAVVGGAQGAAAGAEDTSGGVGARAVGAVKGGVEGAAVGGVGGAIAGPVAAAATAGVSAGRAALKSATNRGWALLAKKLDMSPSQVEGMLNDYKASSGGQSPTVAAIINAKSAANLEPAINQTQGGSAAMMEANAANLAKLPEKVQTAIESSGATKTPFAAQPTMSVKAGPDPLKDLRDGEMDKAMGAIRSRYVQLQPQDMDVLNDPALNDAIAGRLAPMRALQQAVKEVTTGQRNALSLDEVDGIRYQLSRRASTPDKDKALGYRDLANEVGDIGSRDADYGKAYAAYKRQSNFLDGFNHAEGGGSPFKDAPHGIETPEGQAGLELGARSRLVINAGGESQAAKVADTLRQAVPGNHTALNDSFGYAGSGKAQTPQGAAQVSKLQKVGDTFTTERQNYDTLSERSLAPKSDEQISAGQQALNLAAAAHGHTASGFWAHSVGRLLKGYVREDTAKAAVDLLTQPQITAQDAHNFANMLRGIALSDEKKRSIMAVVSSKVARYGAGAVAGQLTAAANSGAQ